ncbi:MAG: hypothetical protein PHV28_18385, partial [Kiritimatiellae bacterium]|nr:hypothetical protein [Kiritimatiellia bacterium]
MIANRTAAATGKAYLLFSGLTPLPPYMYRDMVDGKSYPEQEITDWFCPLTSVYDFKLSEELRGKGR